MKNSFTVVLCSCLLLAACSKQADEFTAFDEATIYSVKYPCGSTCTGQGWILETSAGTAYEPTNLPADFASHALPVKVLYSKTGRRAAPYSGTGEELITIKKIERR
jgi:hypothetical protein